MTTFIFQGNPDRFDIDGYLAGAKERVSWLMTSSYKEITAGDRVFIWRAKGTKRLYQSSGIIAECIVEGSASIRPDDPEAVPFWTEKSDANAAYRVWLRLFRVAAKGTLLGEKQIAGNPRLTNVGPIGYRAGTNYKLKPSESEELNKLWNNFVNSRYFEEIKHEFDVQVSIFEKLSLTRLIEEYQSDLSKIADRPARYQVSTFVFQRNPLVKAIARVRAGFRCEVPDCVTPSFASISDEPYCEVHHLLRLAGGGKDTIENVVCVCANHHRELHVGKRREELTSLLRSIRD
jgi:hypothetical protein